MPRRHLRVVTLARSPGARCPPRPNHPRPSGVLTADPTYGLGLWRNGAVRGILWPHGYSARYELGGIVLINPSGRIVAREGDDVVMAGFTSDDRISHPCNEPNGVEVVR